MIRKKKSYLESEVHPCVPCLPWFLNSLFQVSRIPVLSASSQIPTRVLAVHRIDGKGDFTLNRTMIEIYLIGIVSCLFVVAFAVGVLIDSDKAPVEIERTGVR